MCSDPEVALAVKTILLLPVSNTKRARTITGKISANPNPILLGKAAWYFMGDERSLGRRGARFDLSGPGKTGNQEQETVRPDRNPMDCWIRRYYDFRLYGNSQPEARLDSVLVRRAIDSAPMALRDLADEVRRGNIDLAELSRFVAAVVPDCFRSPHFRQFFGSFFAS